ncbi:MAG: GNAT family N-acetyltransferase [Planctomycetes bacterium]|nr:GNAT family N-acetyltransferase [Planctomycetota bacterium]
MPRFQPFLARSISAADTDEVLQLARAASAHGIYVGNAVLAREGEVVALFGRDHLLGCLWFGPRGNLIVLESEPLDPELVAIAVHESRWPWRIALGPDPTVALLSQRVVGKVLVNRAQVYHGCQPVAVVHQKPPVVVRKAQHEDRERLIAATLELNRVDLKVDPHRVDRRWLRDMVNSRIGDGSTLVIGEVGKPLCKLDIGSRGAFGIVIEGVFTFPEQRGRGLATRLVAVAASDASTPYSCLHVAADNGPARSAYVRAGMHEVGRCRLLLLG